MVTEKTVIDERKCPELNIIAQTETGFFILPHKLLRPYIAHYSVNFRVDLVPSGALTLIPDASGCLVFTLQDDKLDGLFWGATTKVVTVKNDYNEIQMRLFVGFQPGGANYLLGCPQSETVDLILNTDDYSSGLSREIKNMLDSCKNLQELIQGLDRFFLKRLAGRDNTAVKIASYIQSRHGNVSVREISEQSFYSERHLNRIFNESIGMSVKTYSRLLRVNCAAQVLKSSRKQYIDRLYDFGYFDQPHFIHDFKSICGVTPTEYLKNMSAFYNEEHKFDSIL
jgi:AraC-like DNA-binding protein